MERGLGIKTMLTSLAALVAVMVEGKVEAKVWQEAR